MFRQISLKFVPIFFLIHSNSENVEKRVKMKRTNEKVRKKRDTEREIESEREKLKFKIFYNRNNSNLREKITFQKVDGVLFGSKNFFYKNKENYSKIKEKLICLFFLDFQPIYNLFFIYIYVYIYM